MKELNSEEIKKICTNILKEFDDICQKNNLRYSIFGGTLLGAVRHKGFIPWDDDIDVMMPREDYEKLLLLKINNESFEIKNFKYTSNYYYPFAKMIDKSTYIEEDDRCDKDMGVFIDIFPIDYIDSNKIPILKLRIFSKLGFYIGCNPKYKNNKNIFKYLIKKIMYIVLLPFRKMILLKSERLIRSKNQKYCVQMMQYNSNNHLYYPKIFWEHITDYSFENIKVKGIKDYDYYLTNIYGDYMSLPPKEQQITHHHFKAYKRDN